MEILFVISLALVVYPYLGYPLVLFVLSWFSRREASAYDNDYRPSISLLMAAYDEEEWVKAKIENCLSLNYPAESLQIIIGSDCSSDRTNEIVAEYENKGVRLLPFQQRRGKMAVVNDLVKEADNEIVVLSDVSELFDEDALTKLVRHFADPEIGAVTGNHIYNQGGAGIGLGTRVYWRFQRWLQRIESRLHSVCQCDGTIYACRKALFPYPDSSTINDDVAVALGVVQQKKRVIYDPEAVIRGDAIEGIERFFWQKVRGQAGRYQIFARFKSLFFPWPPLRWLVFVSHCVSPVMVPWFLILTFVSNTFLISRGGFFAVFFALQCAFYLIAGVGALAERFKISLKVASVPFYFVMANVGSLCGFFVFLARSQSPAWRKVQ